MTDLIERLRGIAGFETATNEMNVRQHTCWKAADEIERLTAERDMLVQALKKIQAENDDCIVHTICLESLATYEQIMGEK